MQSISYNLLRKYLLESEEFVDVDDFDIDEIIDSIVMNLKMFKDITFSKIDETEDYVIVTVNANNPLKARSDLASWKFSHATNFIVEPMRKTSRDGFQLEVYDENGMPFEKAIYIRIRRGGQFNAGVQHEMDFISLLKNLNADSICFKDNDGNKLVLNDVENIRDCSKDAGSRTGNRADIEITYGGGKVSRISLKKDSAHKVAGLIRKFASESFKIGRAVRQQFIKKKIPFSDRLITVPITNPDLYLWCMFGNDIKSNGAIIKTTIKPEDAKVVGNKAIISVNQLVSPKLDVKTLMQKYPIYFYMDMDKRGRVTVNSAVMGVFGRRYLMNDLIIPGINSKLTTESNKSDSNYKYSIYCGYNLFTDCDENREIFTKRIQISNMGNRGKIPVAIVSESDTDIKFRFWKYNELQHCYGPELYDGESIGNISNIEYGKWVSNGGCRMKPLE